MSKYRDINPNCAKRALSSCKNRIETLHSRELQTKRSRALHNEETKIRAVKKQIPTKPTLWGDGCADDGELLYDMYNCPNCGKSYELEYEEYKYCPECGQRLDWSVN